MLKITFTAFFSLIGLNTGLSSPRPVLPADWNSPNYETKDLTCGQTYSVIKEGYIKFTLNSENSCYYGFLGSRNLRCTVAILCSGTIDFAPATGDVCEIEYLSLSDGTLGHMGGCDSFSFKNTPRIPRNGGSDVHLTYKGKSVDSSCVAFCKQDLNREHTTAGIKTSKRLTRNKYFTGLKTLPSCTCGMRRIGGRIVGGEDALKYEFPWLGFLVYKKDNLTNSRKPFCGASLISNSHAITAAHCMFDYYKDDEPFFGGDIQLILHAHVASRPLPENAKEDESYTSIPGWTRYKLNPENDTTENSIRVDIEEIIIHPFYKNHRRYKFDYDVAILKLKQKVDLYDGRALPICLPFLNESVTYKDGDKMTVAGWGLLNDTAPAGSLILQKVELPYVTSNTCGKYMKTVTPRQICAGYLEGGKDSCGGDSGGPLIFDKFISDKNQNILAGIVSYGIKCALKDKLGIYSDVQELLSWINYHLAKHDALFCKR